MVMVRVKVKVRGRVNLLGRVCVSAAVKVAVQLGVLLEDGGKLVEGGGVLALLDRVKGVQAPRLRHANRRGLRRLVARAVELHGVALEQLLPRSGLG